MSSHVYQEIYLHFNWHTKGDSPLLTGATGFNRWGTA
jgi:hypothetical protein